MTVDLSKSATGGAASVVRRTFLGMGAAGLATLLWPSIADAAMELWEEGDPLCRVPYKALAEPNGYQLDLKFLESFIALSETATGVAPVERHLANQYMERYATHPQLSKNLGLLIQAYQQLGSARPTEEEVRARIWQSTDPVLRMSAKQLVYLWYISAFYLPLDVNPDPAAPPLEDNPADTRKKVWVYGTPEQYERGLIWQVIRAHAPMTPGGTREHWIKPPIG